MAKFDRLVIYGEQQPESDVSAIARVIIMLARLRLRRSAQQQQTTDKEAAA